MPERLRFDEFEFSLTTIPPSSRQTKWALAIVVALVIAFAIISPFAAKQLARIDSFVPVVQAIVLVTDLTTAVLLFNLFATIGTRSLLVLASGYLFSALIVIPHALSYPGAFTQTGLLGGGIQGTPWLYIFWHFGFPASVLAYAYLKDKTLTASEAIISPTRPQILFAVVTVVGLVCFLAWAVTGEGKSVPRLLTDEIRFAPLANYTTGIDLFISLIALLVLWLRRSSVLDLWLMVAMCATVVEQAVVSLFIASRFSLGFYASRGFSVVVSTVVLFALLSETISLYTRVSIANKRLRRERGNRLMNLEVALAAVAHEIKQPLTGIAAKGSAAQRFLDRTPPDIARVRSLLEDVVNASFRANGVIDDVRSLFKAADDEGGPTIEVNQLVLEALQILQADLTGHGIAVGTKLTAELPFIHGHKGQLQEVVINVIQNAIDAMSEVWRGRRFLSIETGAADSGAIVIAVEDSGPGIDPQYQENIFDPFVTTKRQGMGLGLAICQMIVERHDGQLSASLGVEGGARFKITLPIKAASNRDRMNSIVTIGSGFS